MLDTRSAFDALLDEAWDMGATVQWGHMVREHEHWWIRITLPGNQVEECAAETLDICAAVLVRNVLTYKPPEKEPE